MIENGLAISRIYLLILLGGVLGTLLLSDIRHRILACFLTLNTCGAIAISKANGLSTQISVLFVYCFLIVFFIFYSKEICSRKSNMND